MELAAKTGSLMPMAMCKAWTRPFTKFLERYQYLAVATDAAAGSDDCRPTAWLPSGREANGPGKLDNETATRAILEQKYPALRGRV
jgi:hypothetical protein